MMKSFLFNEPLLPTGFQFPQKYRELSESGLWPNLEPWSFLATSKPLSLSYFSDMLLKFPQTVLVPFACINDSSGFYNDGWVVLACFDSSSTQGEPCIRIYDYGSPKNSPWDNFSYKNFEEWIAVAQKESTQFKAERAEIENED